MTYRIVLADDHALIRHSIRQILEIKHGIEVIAEACDGLDLLEILSAGSVLPDLVIVDISMPRLEGIEAARRIKSLYPDIKTLILTMHDDHEYLARALGAGAVGYVFKEDAVAELLPAIGHIRKGKTYISSALKGENTSLSEHPHSD
jgi:two-component system, NarL family, response regulator NreC